MATNVINSVLGAGSLRGRTLANPRNPDDIRNYIPLDVMQPAVRQSSMGDFFKCQRLFLFKDRMGLIPKGYSPAATIGQFFHLAHSARRRGLEEPGVNQVLSHAVNDLSAALEAWADENEGRMDRATWKLESVERDAAMARVMSQLHVEKFPLHSDPCWACGQKGCTGLTVVSAEEDFQTRVDDVPSFLEGRLDTVLHHAGNGLDGLIIEDHKTIGWDTTEWMESKGFATQPRLYRILVDGATRFKGIPIIGFLYNLIRRPSCQFKAWQTFPDYVRECRDWYNAQADSVGAPKESTGKKGGYILDKETGEPKLYPQWDWTGNAADWVTSPPIRRAFLPFDEPILTEEFLHKLQLVSKASNCEPLLSQFLTTGEDSGGCRFFNKRCAYLDFCSQPPETWDEVFQRGWTIRGTGPESAEIEDYL